MKKYSKIIISAAAILTVAVAAIIIWVWKSSPSTQSESPETALMKQAARKHAVDATQCERIIGTPTASGSGAMIQTDEGRYAFSTIAVPVKDNGNYDVEKYKTAFDTEDIDRAIWAPTPGARAQFAQDSPSKEGEPPKISSLRGTEYARNELNIQIPKIATTPKTVRLDIYFTTEVSAVEMKNKKVIKGYKFSAEQYCGTIEYKQAADGSVSDPQTIQTNQSQTVRAREI